MTEKTGSEQTQDQPTSTQSDDSNSETPVTSSAAAAASETGDVTPEDAPVSEVETSSAVVDPDEASAPADMPETADAVAEGSSVTETIEAAVPAPDAPEADGSEPAGDVDAEGEDDDDRARTWDELDLPPTLRSAIDALGWTAPTPVQARSFPVMILGTDVLVQSQTGSGKTGAFCLPWIANRFVPGPASETGVQMIVLLPTRELAKQVCNELVRLAVDSPVDVLPVYGGTAMSPQLDALNAGVHAVVGTPGRILDHIRRRSLDLSKVRTVVLDECDEMLSMGFMEDIRNILSACPEERQTCLFSATVPRAIERIARKQMRDPVRLELSGDEIAAAQIDHAYYSTSGNIKTRDLIDVLMIEEPASAIIFCNTREETRVVASVLLKHDYSAAALSSDLTQVAREKVMAKFRERKLRFLVATDVAARGIDVSHISHVINYSFPPNSEVYVHRTGRTGRAGRAGIALSILSPLEIGSFYMLNKIYKSILFTERKLPPKAELAATRTQRKLDIISSEFQQPVSPEWLLLARNLIQDPRGDRIVAYLLNTAIEESKRKTKSKSEEAEEEGLMEFRERPERGDRDRGGGRGERDRGERGRGDRHGGRGRDRDRQGGRDRDRRGGRDRERDSGDRGERSARAPHSHDESEPTPRRRSRSRSERDTKVSETPIEAAKTQVPQAPAAEVPVAPASPAAQPDGAAQPVAAQPVAAQPDGAAQPVAAQPDGAATEAEATLDAPAQDPQSEDAKDDAAQQGADAQAPADDSEDKPKRRRRRRRRRKPTTEGEGAGEGEGSEDKQGSEAAKGEAAAVGEAAAEGEAAAAEGEADVAEGKAGESEGEDDKPKRKRRRRRRRRPKGDAEDSDSETRSENDGADKTADADSGATDNDGAEGKDKKDGSRRRRRRRRGGGSGGRGSDTAAAPPAAPTRVSQDDIVIDIDQNELDAVRTEFGEIDELDELTLKARRRAVLDDITDEVEVEDLTASDAADADAADAAADAEDDDSEDEATNAAPPAEGEAAADAPRDGDDSAAADTEEEAAQKKKRRRRRRRKKAPPAPPELTCPPHKDFWEVWAGKFSAADFEREEDSIEISEAAVEASLPREEPEEQPADVPLLEDSGVDELMRVGLNIGRSHGHKSSHVRSLLKRTTGLHGKAVKDLTVRDKNSLFRIDARHFEAVAARLEGEVIEGVSLSLVAVSDESGDPLRLPDDAPVPLPDVGALAAIDQEAAEPEAGAAEPEAPVAAVEAEPEAKAAEPEAPVAAVEAEPEAKATEPEATEPEAEAAEPEAEAAEPEAKAAEPEPEAEAAASPDGD